MKKNICSVLTVFPWNHFFQGKTVSYLFLIFVC